MFYAKQFKDLLDKVKELDPDAKVVPRLLRIDFNLPLVGKCRLEYVHRGFDDEYDARGTMKLYYGDNMTEFDSFRYTVDGLEGLDRAIKRNMEQSPVNESVEEIEDFTTMSADDLSGDVVSYLYDKYKDAAFIGEKSLPDGSIVLRFDWNGVDKDAVAKDLKDRYGDRIGFGSGHLQYAPEIKFGAIKVLPANDTVAVTESINTDKFELVENFPIWAIEPLVNDSWGDYLQYNGEELAREDFSDIDNFMTTHGYCGIHAPSDELYDQTHSGFTSRPAFGKSTDTCSVYAIKGPWKSLMKEYGLETASPVTEATDGQPKELTEDGVQHTIDSLGLQVINKWYDGNKSRPVFDCKTADGRILCVWNEPPYEVKLWFKDADPRDNGLVEDIDTLDDLKANLSRLAGVQINDTSKEDSMLDPVDEDDVERSVANSIDTAMMDHYDMMNGDIGDFESVEFYKDVKTVCEMAGKPALAEAVIKLHKAYHPVLEAVEKAHKVPRDIAVAFNDYIADTLYKRPETHDMLKEREFEPNWKWLDDNAGAVIKVWNETHDPSEIKRLLDNLDEDAACWFEGI
jgi:hypothetical protein